MADFNINRTINRKYVSLPRASKFCRSMRGFSKKLQDTRNVSKPWNFRQLPDFNWYRLFLLFSGIGNTLKECKIFKRDEK